MAKNRKQAEFSKIPRVITPTPEQVLPDLLTAFERWKELGEYPKNAVLCEFVGCNCERDGAAYKIVATGERVNPENWTFLTEIQFKPGKVARGMFVIFEKTN